MQDMQVLVNFAQRLARLLDILFDQRSREVVIIVIVHLHRLSERDLGAARTSSSWPKTSRSITPASAPFDGSNGAAFAAGLALAAAELGGGGAGAACASNACQHPSALA